MGLFEKLVGRDDDLGPDRGTMDQLEARKERARIEGRREKERERVQDAVSEAREEGRKDAETLREKASRVAGTLAEKADDVDVSDPDFGASGDKSPFADRDGKDLGQEFLDDEIGDDQGSQDDLLDF
jgi:hypothetical protein